MSSPSTALQRWMQAVVVHPGTSTTAVVAPEAEADAARRADRRGASCPRGPCTPAERVGIYHGMYLLRMDEALAADYPGLEHFLGDDGFGDLVRDYVQAPPLAQLHPEPPGRPPARLREDRAGRRAGRDFCHDLARLELAITQVFDAPETQALDRRTQIAAVPAEAWENARASCRWPPSAC